MLSPARETMTRKSALTVSYKDVVNVAARAVSEAQTRYDGAKARGTSNLQPLAHDLEAAKTLHRLIKKWEPGQQTNLFTLYETLR
jgi:hypothetical protein